MKFLKNIKDYLFPEEKEETEVIKEIPEGAEIEGLEPKQVCAHCEEDIIPGSKCKKIAGKIFHRKCFKQMKKAATKMTFG